MGSYIARRSLQGLLTLLLVIFLLHLLTTLAIQLNGNPAEAFFGDRIPSKAALAAVSERFGLGDPCYSQVGNPCFGQFFSRLGGYLHGDFGTNLRGRPVIDIVGSAAPNTLRLFVVVVITWLLVGMTLGTVAARWRGRARDHGIRGLSVLIDAVPIFVLLLIYKHILSVPLNGWAKDVFGAGSLPDLWFRPSHSADHPFATIVVPGILLGLVGSASFIRLVRAAQLESWQSEHVRTARSRGLGEWHIAGRHVIRNSAVPVVTALGFVFADALAGAVITEGVMNIHGMGGVLWTAVQDSDVGVVIGMVTLLSIVTVVVMLVVDILYAALDPRIRYD